MRLCFGLGVGFRHAMAFEGEAIAGVGVGEDGLDLADGLPGKAVDGYGALHALIADMVGNDAATPAAIGGPNYCPTSFFWT